MPADRLTARLRDALEQGDEIALLGLLAREVTLVIDSGDRSGGRWSGRGAVVRVLLDRMAQHGDARLHQLQVNAAPGLALRRPDGVVIAVLAVDAACDVVDELWLLTAADKLHGFNPAT